MAGSAEPGDWEETESYNNTEDLRAREWDFQGATEQVFGSWQVIGTVFPFQKWEKDKCPEWEPCGVAWCLEAPCLLSLLCPTSSPIEFWPQVIRLQINSEHFTFLCWISSFSPLEWFITNSVSMWCINIKKQVLSDSISKTAMIHRGLCWKIGGKYAGVQISLIWRCCSRSWKMHPLHQMLSWNYPLFGWQMDCHFNQTVMLNLCGLGSSRTSCLESDFYVRIPKLAYWTTEAVRETHSFLGPT